MKFNKITLSLSIILAFSISNNQLSFSKEKKVIEKNNAKKITKQDELNSKLFNAISNRNIGLVKKLIEEGANVNIKKDLSSSQKGFTPLILATNLNEKEISRILVSKGADVNLSDKEGKTPISNILYRNNRDFINIFLNAGLKEDIFLFIELEEFDRINNLIQKGYDLNQKNKNGKLPLIEACKKGNKKIIELLLDKGADITLRDSDGDTSLIGLASSFAFSDYDLNKKEINYLEIANLLLDKGVNINAKNTSKSTALKYAVLSDNKDLAKLLLDKGSRYDINDAISMKDLEKVKNFLSKGVNVNNKDEDGNTPLLTACSIGDKNIVELLISKGAKVNQKNEYELTPIVRAVQSGNIELVKLLLDKGANVNAISDDYENPILNVAIMNNFPEIAKLLLNKGSNPNLEGNYYGNKPLYEAIKKIYESPDIKEDTPEMKDPEVKKKFIEKYYEDYKEVAKLLIDKGAEYKSFDLAISGQYKKLKKWIDDGLDINEIDENTSYSLLTGAIVANNKDIVELLVKNGVNINQKDSNDELPISYALEKNNKEILNLLINKDYKNKKEWDELIKSAYYGNQEMVEFFLSKGANVNYKTKYGNTPLKSAIEKGNKDMVDYLISKGADINIKDIEDNNFLIESVKSGNKELVQLFIEKGIDINSKNKIGYTPLIYASRNNKKEIVELLLEQKPQINLIDKEGNSALLFACENQNKEIVDLLIKSGADVNHKNNNGWTPLLKTRENSFNDLDYILGNEQKDYKKIEDLLIKAGAKE